MLYLNHIKTELIIILWDIFTLCYICITNYEVIVLESVL